MKGSTKNPKVFISYSWSSPQHKNWVIDLAERLSVDGIHVIIDEWDLKEGQDMFHFMEKMVKDKNITKVLVVTDKHYQKKADERMGGVGTESQLISKEVYEDVNQEKFIPIIKEKDGNELPCLPVFMKSRIYIDLSSEEKFEEEYEKLVRNIYGRPLSKRPPMGIAPAYILEEDPVILRTAQKTKEIKNLVSKTEKDPSGHIEDYLDDFLKNVEDFKIDKISSEENVDDIVLQKIEKMLPLRNDFVEFVKTLFKYDSKVDLEQFKDFFEKLIRLQFKPEDVSSWNKLQFDHYRFFGYELFLYFIATLIKLKKFKEIAYFIYHQYFFRYDNMGDIKNSNFSIFNGFLISLEEYRKQRLKLNRVSITADLIKERADNKYLTFQDILNTDLLLHYLSILQQENSLSGSGGWFPRCTVYNRWGSSIELLEKAISREHNERIKFIFGAKSSEELKNAVNKISEIQKSDNYQKYDRFYYEIPNIDQIIKIEKINSIN
jgi:hypothetical protein